MEIHDMDAFIDSIAKAVVDKIDEREKINLIAQAVIDHMQQLKEKDKCVD